MDTRFPINRAKHASAARPRCRSLVILVPVLFGLIGFAIDLGIIYVVKGELKAAANCHGAGRRAAADRHRRRYRRSHGSRAAHDPERPRTSGINTTSTGSPSASNSGSLVSTVHPPAYYAHCGRRAIASRGQRRRRRGRRIAGQVRGLHRHRADSSGLLEFSAHREQPQHHAWWPRAVAGISAPLCTACAIEPFAVAAIDQTDTTDFGFILNELYSFTICARARPPRRSSPAPRR